MYLSLHGKAIYPQWWLCPSQWHWWGWCWSTLQHWEKQLLQILKWRRYSSVQGHWYSLFWSTWRSSLNIRRSDRRRFFPERGSWSSTLEGWHRYVLLLTLLLAPCTETAWTWYKQNYCFPFSFIKEFNNCRDPTWQKLIWFNEFQTKLVIVGIGPGT